MSHWADNVFSVNMHRNAGQKNIVGTHKSILRQWSLFQVLLDKGFVLAELGWVYNKESVGRFIIYATRFSSMHLFSAGHE